MAFRSASLRASIGHSTWYHSNRRQKSLAAVGSGIRCAPRRQYSMRRVQLRRFFCVLRFTRKGLLRNFQTEMDFDSRWFGG